MRESLWCDGVVKDWKVEIAWILYAIVAFESYCGGDIDIIERQRGNISLERMALVSNLPQRCKQFIA